MAFAVGRFSSETPVTSQNYYEPDRGIKEDEHKGVWEQNQKEEKHLSIRLLTASKKVHNYNLHRTQST